MKTNFKAIKKIIVFIFLFGIIGICYGQDYLRGIGVKVGGYSAYMAVSYKEYLTQRMSLETSVGKNTGSGDKNVSLQLIVQMNQKFSNTNGLSWYAGAGPSTLYWYNSFGSTEGRKSYIQNESKLRAVVNTVIGLESIIGQLPLSVSIDAGPSFYVYPYTKTNWMLNASIKYIVRNHKFCAHYRLSKKAYRSRGRRY